MKLGLGIALVMLASSAVVHADAGDTFERKATGAVKVKDLDDVVWALTATCDKGDELQQRQCRLIRDARVKQLTGATLLVDGDANAFELGVWNGAKRSVAVTLTACIRCDGVQLDGRTWYLTGSPARQDGAKITAAPLFDTARQFPDEARAKKYLEVMKGARTQFVVRIPEKRRWLVGGKDGLLFEVLAWRVVVPCTGEVVIASPASGPADKDASVCAAGAASEPEAVPALTREMVREAMQPVMQGARACYAKYKSAGTARLELTIAGSGSVASYMQKGDFKGTPMGTCIDAAVSNVVFPPSQRPLTTIGFPIVLP
ncbi:MAG: hypothetical protein SFX73_18900 [Kofleriaceae bacterium]|nr:hypothetical protein [Kofleriaceae bacterium]